jgi:hypothetical protein
MGIDPLTFDRWKQRARRYNPAEKESRADKPCYLFFREIYRARAVAFRRLLERINQAGIECQTAPSLRRLQVLTFLTERLFPTGFGNRKTLEKEEIQELLDAAIQQIAARGIGQPPVGTGENMTPSPGSREPEDWETL